MVRSAFLPALALAAAALSGCGPAVSTWSPPPPAGATYLYDHQGFSQQGTTVVAGAAAGGPMSMGFGGAGTTREVSGVTGENVPDPLGESQPIDGVRFNEHLEGRGERLLPSPAGTPAPLAPGARACASGPC